ncbi:YqcC family protein [Plasticicumulans sp.]|uniref:YqcC family protein n=1 Tax=Plasticicumulans sp. TaxID=2307179 RepID=UPI000F91BC40|nr:YqcC family protein [Pseudomonadota bacterium]MBS0600685.1 YqcC family protein [Pseudomonadota bacterium]RTK97934.1 MAG: YqcC family protein [Xanthomonadales bacterium]HMV55423.1 YqcC family protein [Rhodocyclaceae bacterium]
MSPPIAEVRIALFELEAELRRLGFWQAEAPAPERLASSVPFCHDTLEFHEWLQWVFLPRLEAMLASAHLPPFACQIAPLAELSWEHDGREVAHAVALLARIDDLLGDPAQRAH